MNQLLLQKAREQKIIRGRKMRVDITVVESTMVLTKSGINDNNIHDILNCLGKKMELAIGLEPITC